MPQTQIGLVPDNDVVDVNANAVIGAESETEKALLVYEVIKDFMETKNIENTAQVYEAAQKSWEGLRVLAEVCDIVGYPEREAA